MKKIVISLICLLLLPAVSGGVQFLKLRASHHQGFQRIVMEGPESVISKALVYQRGKNIIVNFPDVSFPLSQRMSPYYIARLINTRSCFIQVNSGA
jgi:hypothetical protein